MGDTLEGAEMVKRRLFDRRQILKGGLITGAGVLSSKLNALSAAQVSPKYIDDARTKPVFVEDWSDTGSPFCPHGPGIVLELGSPTGQYRTYYIFGTVDIVKNTECRLFWRPINNLAAYESIELPYDPDCGKGVADLHYSPKRKKLYVLMARSNTVLSVDSWTFVQQLSTTPNQDPWATGGLGNLVLDDANGCYYVICQSRPTVLHKHDMTTGEVVVSNYLASEGYRNDCGHSLVMHPVTGALYGHTGDMTEQPRVWEFDTDTLEIVNQVDVPTLGATHECVVVPSANEPTPDYLFVCIEGSLNADGKFPLVRVRLDTFEVDEIFTPFWTGGCWGVSLYDDRLYVAYGGVPSRVMRMNPWTLEYDVYEFPRGFNGLCGSPTLYQGCLYGTHYLANSWDGDESTRHLYSARTTRYRLMRR